jgi:hypothetical protein
VTKSLTCSGDMPSVGKVSRTTPFSAFTSTMLHSYGTVPNQSSFNRPANRPSRTCQSLRQARMPDVTHP